MKGGCDQTGGMGRDRPQIIGSNNKVVPKSGAGVARDLAMLVHRRGRDCHCWVGGGKFDKTTPVIVAHYGKHLPPTFMAIDRFVFKIGYRVAFFCHPYSEWLNKDIEIVPGGWHLTEVFSVLKSLRRCCLTRGCLEKIASEVVAFKAVASEAAASRKVASEVIA